MNSQMLNTGLVQCEGLWLSRAILGNNISSSTVQVREKGLTVPGKLGLLHWPA